MRAWLTVPLLSLCILRCFLEGLDEEDLFYSFSFIYPPCPFPTASPPATTPRYPLRRSFPTFCSPFYCLQPPSVCSPHATGGEGEPLTPLQQLQSGAAVRSVSLTNTQRSIITQTNTCVKNMYMFTLRYSEILQQCNILLGNVVYLCGKVFITTSAFHI